jgi:alpha-mannosidase
MKKAEDENALVVRFYEWAGKQGEVTLELPQGAQSASETNLMEKAEGSIPVRNDAITVSTKPYEIKTVRVAFADKSQTAAAQP